MIIQIIDPMVKLSKKPWNDSWIRVLGDPWNYVESVSLKHRSTTIEVFYPKTHLKDITREKSETLPMSFFCPGKHDLITFIGLFTLPNVFVFLLLRPVKSQRTNTTPWDKTHVLNKIGICASAESIIQLYRTTKKGCSFSYDDPADTKPPILSTDELMT